jgi:uncharacterized protein YecE (DUF72 family)
MENGLRELGDQMGVLLVQLPPHFPCDLPRLSYFLGRVPPERKVAVEFRHPSWHQDEVFDLLERHGAAYCVMSGAHLPCVLRATAPFVYVRLHGPDPDYLYGGSYPDDDLRWWAERIREWHDGQGRDVWAYFNNDGDGNAVRNADTLNGLLEV